VYKGREVWIVKLKGVNTPEEAQVIRGHALLVHESVRDTLDDEDEFYIQQLIGLRVEILESREIVGVVDDIMDGTGTHDVLCVLGTEGQRILLPFVKDIVPVVDIDDKVLRITPPDGLLDIYKPKQAGDSTGNRKSRKRREREFPAGPQ